MRRLGAEIEMWLHGHAAQRRARRASVKPPVNALWLWGAAGRDVGRAAAGEARRSGAPSARTPAFAVCGIFTAAPARHCRRTLARWPQGGAGAVLALAVADELRMSMASTFLQALRALDERFIAPALTQLRRGRS